VALLGLAAFGAYVSWSPAAPAESPPRPLDVTPIVPVDPVAGPTVPMQPMQPSTMQLIPDPPEEPGDGSLSTPTMEGTGGSAVTTPMTTTTTTTSEDRHADRDRRADPSDRPRRSTSGPVSDRERTIVSRLAALVAENCVTDLPLGEDSALFTAVVTVGPDGRQQRSTFSPMPPGGVAYCFNMHSLQTSFEATGQTRTLRVRVNVSR
jgi:hypothetical protein